MLDVGTLLWQLLHWPADETQFSFHRFEFVKLFIFSILRYSVFAIVFQTEQIDVCT